MSTELRLDHTVTGSNKHGKSAKDIRLTYLVKNNMSGFNIQKQCLEQDNNMLHDQIIAKQGMA